MPEAVSTSPKWSVNWVDVAKSLRAGIIALIGAFVTGIIGVAPQLDIADAMKNPKVIVSTLVLAGLTAVFDLLRRWITNYAAPTV